MANELDWGSIFEVLEESAEETELPPGAMTTAELAEHYGKSRKWVRRRLDFLIRAGKVAVAPVKDTNMVGKQFMTYRYYRVKEDERDLL